jgi:8-oxo-dGTP pyrophosphatase MutT (NUDIX family)
VLNGGAAGESLILRLPGPPPGAPGAACQDRRDPSGDSQAARLQSAARRALGGRAPLRGRLRVAVAWSGAEAPLGAGAVLDAVVACLTGVAFTAASQVTDASCVHQPGHDRSGGEAFTVRVVAAGDRRHTTASVFAVCGDRVLLLRHRRKGLWLPPGGHVEADESAVAAAVREVAEETGIEVDLTSAPVPGGPSALPRPEALLDIEVEPGHRHQDLVFFAEPRGRPARPPEPVAGEEAAEVRWVPAGQLDGLADALPRDVAALARRALAAARRPVP